MAGSPREFATAMRDLVERSQRQPATAVSEEAYQMKLRVLDHFIHRDPQPEAFERVLQERISDSDPEKELSKSVCRQILNSWRSGSVYYTPDGRLVLRALYPADRSLGAEDDDAQEG